MLKSYQLQQRAADHDIYAKIMEQWIQLNYVGLKNYIFACTQQLHAWTKIRINYHTTTRDTGPRGKAVSLLLQ